MMNEAWIVWLNRAWICAIMLIALALIIKITLIAPMSELDYKIKVNRILKGDMEI